ncbi:hypothetical protein M9Y10_040374 [Tritrichomonas musculus]|uniref:Phosphatidylinositol-specific phospholipase C X domain-containing protein n=1 Tax=Tritrichomonas musculus TaxID=1915356 RepID=A0ABR2GPM5_9EUKA
MKFFLLSFLLAFSISQIRYGEDIRVQEEIASIKFYEFRLTPEIQKPRPRLSQLPNSDFPASDWLKLVDDNKKIFSLSIPGTHETCARYGGVLTECQEWTIEEQLLNGVRYLDIRCRHISDVFMIHHGLVYQQLSFGAGVRDVCINFLKNHPSEFIFMQIKEEYEATNNTRTFSETMQSYIEGNEEFFYLKEDSPTLEKVRGKIVILRRFDPVYSPQGNYLQFQDNKIFTSQTTITARIQDCYVVPTMFERSTKWNHVSQILDEAANNTDKDKLFVNFGSGTSPLCFPYVVAEYITPKIGYYLEVTNPNTFVGVIMFDFVNLYYNDVIEILAKRNFI